jgi:hypothetical protein
MNRLNRRRFLALGAASTASVVRKVRPPHVWSPKADPPTSRGGAARPRPLCCRSLWRAIREERVGYDRVVRTKLIRYLTNRGNPNW